MYARIMVILVTLTGNYFLYFQVFPKILALSTTTLTSRFSDPTWWQSTLVEPSEKTEEILKKAEGRVLFVDEAYSLSWH